MLERENVRVKSENWLEELGKMYETSGEAETAGNELTPNLPHLSESEVLFLGFVVRMPREKRPHGLITWLSKAFKVSRKGIYEIGRRIGERLFGDQPNLAEQIKERTLIEASWARANRLILRAMFPGNVSIRPTQQIVEEALGRRPSVGYISELRLAAGKKAREYLRQLDYSGIGRVIVGRDETYLGGMPVLIVIDPVSMTILLAEACTDRQAETWGAALLIAQEQGARIKGLIEDMAQNYSKSQKLASLSKVEVQKDTWHVLRDGGKLRNQLEKTAYKAIKRVIQIEKRLLKKWSDADFEAYVLAVSVEEKAIEQYDTFACLNAHLCDALELVDWRSGEIRDPETAAWLLDETLNEMATCTDARIPPFLNMLRNHQSQLLTFLSWLHQDLLNWQQQLQQAIPGRQAATLFQQLVAQQWWVQQKLIAGYSQWQSFADEITLRLMDFTDFLPSLSELSHSLLRIFDAAGHTNSITESINSLLKSFLNVRQSFQSIDSFQAYLDLFTLWHNTRRFERGKRQGQSPFHLAGIHTPSDDWLDLLGY